MTMTEQHIQKESMGEERINKNLQYVLIVFSPLISIISLLCMKV